MKKGKLSGDYIAGFVDGEGCFALKFVREVKYSRLGKPEYFYWDIEFVISLKQDDKNILERIRDSLECGLVSGPNKNGAVRYAVNKIDDLRDKILPFFEKYPLQAKKRSEFELWREAVDIFYKNKKKVVSTGKIDNSSQKNRWNPKDLKRIEEIKKLMEIYKGGNRHDWKWI